MMLMQEGSICFVFKKLGSHSIVGIEVTEQSLSLIHFILLELAFTNTIGIYPQQKIKRLSYRAGRAATNSQSFSTPWMAWGRLRSDGMHLLPCSRVISVLFQTDVLRFLIHNLQDKVLESLSLTLHHLSNHVPHG